MIPTDTLYGSQWHFSMLGNLGSELLINRIWNEFDGTGIYVGVYDDGIEINHSDLNDNYDASHQVVINGTSLSGNVTAADHEHGTSVAGLIGAEANGQDTVGVAFGVSLTGINIWDTAGPIFINSAEPAILDNFHSAIAQGAMFDVVNHSWGSPPIFDADQNLNVAGSFAERLVEEYARISSVGRSGLGTVIVQAAGNNNLEANGDGVNASRYTITVGAIHNDGFNSSYSNFGANLLISAPAGDYTNYRSGLGIVTTDRIGSEGYNLRSDLTGAFDYTNDFGGTSAATPIVTGVVSLMLDANANMGWRDVQNILALSADHTGSAIGATAPGFEEDNNWFINDATNWNGGGLHFSEDYGFGSVNAYTAVRMAEVWSLFGAAQTSANEVIAAPAIYTIDSVINDLSTTEFDFVVTNSMIAEHVDLTVNFFHSYVTDLNVFLVSPTGTEVQLFRNSVGDAAAAAGGMTWTFGIEAFRGENVAGTWTLRVEDVFAEDVGELFSVQFEAFGTSVNADDVYHYTDEALNMLALNASRLLLVDNDGGTDWINAAAMTANLYIDLNLGGSMLANGAQFAIIGASTIENAVTGDGNDIVYGNGASNSIHVMRGNDVIYGLAGNDILEGGSGNDYLDGGAGSDTVSLAGATVSMSVYLGGFGTAGNGYSWDGIAQDNLTSIENITGSAHNDYLVGDSAANVLEGGGGNDAIDGGLGSDTVSVAGATAGMSVYLGGFGAAGSGYSWDGIAQDNLTSIENIIGSAHNDYLVGDSAANVLEGGLGNDVIDGGLGSDTVSVAGATVGMSVYLGGFGAAGSGYSWDGIAQDNLTSIENIIGSAHNDYLVGDSAANVLEGGGGNDVIDGGLGSDTLSLAGSTVGMSVYLGGFGSAGNGYSWDGIAQDNLTSIENVTGSAHNDYLVGDSAANVLEGGLGNDVIDGGLGSDTLSLAGSTVGMSVYLGGFGAAGSGYSWDGIAQDNLTSIENIIGSAHNDYLVGDSAANVLTGGLGSDTFVFNAALFGTDTIADWQDGSDHISLAGSGLSFASFSVNQSAANTILSLIADPTQTITFLNIASATITVDDFL